MTINSLLFDSDYEAAFNYDPVRAISFKLLDCIGEIRQRARSRGLSGRHCVAISFTSGASSKKLRCRLTTGGAHNLLQYQASNSVSNV